VLAEVGARLGGEAVHASNLGVSVAASARRRHRPFAADTGERGLRD